MICENPGWVIMRLWLMEFDGPLLRLDFDSLSFLD
jgi:hypothetical protein